MTTTIPHPRVASLDTVDAAVQALQQLAHPSYPSSSPIVRILRHMQDCCQTLSQLHQSLQAGLDCLEYRIFPRMLQHPSLDVWLPIWFQYMVRLHDGLIFCISGECRSPYDQQQQQQRKHTSHLPKSSGTYAANRIYSGTSWDEWNDPHNGLVVRYLRALRVSPDQWDTSVIRKYPILEVFWNQLEHEQHMLQQRFREWQTRILPQRLLSQHAVTHVQLLFTDKMEQLTVQWQGTTYHWQRMASWSAEECRRESVLPRGWQTPQDWERAFSSWAVRMESQPPLQKKKRRRIRVDDDDDEEETKESISKPPEWKVRIHQDITTHTTSHEEETSVLQLKQQFGIHAAQLEESHAFVQAEEQKTRREGQRIDQDPAVLLWQEDTEDDRAEQTLETTKMRLHRFRHVLEQLLSKKKKKKNDNDDDDSPQDDDDDDDDDLLWNAREHVRQLAMEVGNQCLWYPVRQETHLQQAYQMFQLAYHMVVQSQRSSSSTESEFYQRTLCLVLGQAQTNMGIVLVEQRKYRVAIPQLQRAGATGRQLLDMIISRDRRSSSEQKEDATLLLQHHEYQAWQLHSLTMRWCGVAHWHLQHREQALSCWNDAASCLSQVVTQPNDQYRDLVQECMTAWIVCADHFREALHQEHPASTKALQSHYEIVQKALQQAIGLAQSLLGRKDDDDEPMYNPTTLQEAATELEQWWKARQQAWQVKLSDHPQVRPERPDMNLAAPPTRRLVWKNPSRREKRTKRAGTYDDERTTTREHVPAPIRSTERPWGDDLFPKSSQGKPLLPTYCGPPPMDPEMAVLAHRLKIVIPPF